MGEMIKVTMPKWGLSMVKGTVNDWVVDEGEEVEKGQELVEIETDKIANVLESPGEGCSTESSLNLAKFCLFQLC